MSYWRDLCQILEVLANSRDISQLTLEILNRLSAWSSEDRYVDNDSIIRDVLGLKILLDQQWTCLSPRSNNRHTLPVHVIVQCLECLTDTTTPLCQNLVEDRNVRDTFLDIFRQAFFSGLRAVLRALQKKREIRPRAAESYLARLKSLIKHWPQETRFDLDWSLPLCTDLLNAICSEPATATVCNIHNAQDMPDRNNLEFACRCIRDRCPQSYKSIFQILEARRMIPPNIADLENVGLSLSVIENAVRERWLAVDGMLARCLSNELSVNNFFYRVDPGPVSNNIVNSWGETPPTNSSSILTSRQNHRIFIEIADDLRRRPSTVSDRLDLLVQLRCKSSDCVRSWLPSERRPSQPRSEVLETNLVYILNCPDLHPIDYDDLLDRLCQDEQEALKKTPEICEVSLECPFHTRNPPQVTRARQVTPLWHISKAIVEKAKALERSQYDQIASQPSPVPLLGDPDRVSDGSVDLKAPDSHDTDGNSRVSSPRPTTRSPTDRSVSESQNGTRNSVSNSLISAFRKKRNSSKLEPEALSVSLSLDGNYLVVWCKTKIKYRSLSNQSCDWSEVVYLDGIIAAAAGIDMYAVVSHNANGYKLLLCDSKGHHEGNFMSLPQKPESLQFSPDGRKLAVGSKNSLRVIAVAYENWAENFQEAYWTVQLKDPATGPSFLSESEIKIHRQISCFSQDSLSVIVTTQYWILSDKKFESRLFDISESLTRGPRYRTGFSSSMNIDLPEHGLTASPCYRNMQTNELYVLYGARSSHSLPDRIKKFNERADQAADEKILGSSRVALSEIKDAVVVAGPVPSFLIISTNDEAHLITRSDSNTTWKDTSVPGVMRHRRSAGVVTSILKIAAPSRDRFVFFELVGDHGRLTVINGTVQESSVQIKSTNFE